MEGLGGGRFGGALGEDFGERIFLPLEGMGDLVPLFDERVESFGQMGLVFEVGDAKPLALQDAKPLFDLVHPRTVDWWMMEHEPRMFGQPGLNLFSLVHAKVVEHDINDGDGRRDLEVQLLQEFDELLLSLAIGGVSVDFARARVERGEQIQGTTAIVLMLDAYWLIWFGGQGRRIPGTRLQAGLLIFAQDHFMRPQPTRIEITDRPRQLREGGIARHLGRQPHLMTPRFQPVTRQNLSHAFDRDRPHDLRVDQLPPDLNAVPLRQRTPRRVGAFASDLHCVDRHLGGKRPAGGRFEVDHSDPASGPE